ncbi:PXA domain protein [Cordyceps militaris CM01]|uniref:PXA domain protein n=1 Tax=Cordyceps militaris (strain CM01) TaxID=983644 RepID=G3J7G0_CORMM|nr:PXA domain protein [Cordyceps militaris CM01]EGX97126.1 PXA domain protein [Cordyceps militaris CM01]
MSASVAAPPARLAAPRSRPSATQHHRDAASGGDGRRAERASSIDPLSDRATLMLIRRVLCPQKLSDKGRDVLPPIEELLPSLTSRNDVDLQLYAFLAIIIREFVQAWYNKITPDETFVAEVLQVIAHCSRALEQRFRALDVESLVLDEIPDLLDRHITAYRMSHDPVSQEPVAVNPRQVYHALFPLPQLSPVPQAGDAKSSQEQMENETAYRQLLVQAVLAILLPTEDLENPCLTAIVGQILSELIVGNLIAGKASQPWLLYESICIAGRVLGEKKIRATQRMVSGRHAPPVKAKGNKERIKWSAQAVFLTMIHFAVMIFTSARLLITTLVASSSLPLRQTAVDFSGGSRATGAHRDVNNHGRPTKVPVLDFKVWQCVGNLIQLDSRMPWLSGFLSLLQYQAVHGPGRLVGLNSPLDRLLSHHIQQMFSASHLPGLLRLLRGVLFPNNAPGQSTLRPPSSDDELAALRTRAASALLGLLPTGVAKVYLGGGALSAATHGGMVDGMEDLVRVLDDEYCNKHLMYSVLELILVRLMPELSEKGVGELWEERLG